MWMAKDGRLLWGDEALPVRRAVVEAVLARHRLERSPAAPLDEGVVKEILAIDRALSLATLSRMLSHG